MNNQKLMSLCKCILFGVLWSLALLLIGKLIANNTSFILNDVLFCEGLLFTILGVFSSISGNPMGLSLQGLGQKNAQYISNANLEITKMEKEKTKDISKAVFSISISMVTLILGGVFTIAYSLFI